MSALRPGIAYLTSREAAERFGVTNDYIARLCRQGKSEGMFIGRTWYVDTDSLAEFLKRMAEQKRERNVSLSKQNSVTRRKEEPTVVRSVAPRSVIPELFEKGVAFALSFALVSGGYALVFSKDLSFDGMQRTLVGEMHRVAMSLVPDREGVRAAAASVWLGFEQGNTRSSFAASRVFNENMRPLYASQSFAAATASLFSASDFAHIAKGFTRASKRVREKHRADTNVVGDARAYLSAAVQNAYRSAFFGPGDTASRDTYAKAGKRLQALLAPVFGFARESQDPIDIFRERVAENSGTENKKETRTSVATAGPTIVNPIVERVVERTTERTVVTGGVTSDALDSRLEQLANSLKSEIYRVSSSASSGISRNFSAIALTQKIDKLEQATLYDVTFSGSVSGLTDAHVPDDITASNYLPLTGGTLTGALTSYGAITGPSFAATSTTATSTFAGGLAIETSGLVYDYQTNKVGIGTESPSNELTIVGSADITGNLGVGTTSPYAKLSVVGEAVAAYFTATSTSATSTVAGRFLVTKAPTIAHTFSPWAIGAAGSGLYDASLLINPASASGDTNLLAAAVNGSVKFLVDAEGDVFTNSLTSVGSVTLSNTTASTFSVEGNTTLGDSISDTTTINGTLVVTGTTTSSTVAGNFGVGTTSPWARLSVAGESSGTGPLFTISTSTASATSTAVIVDSQGRLGIGTTSPGAALSVQGNVLVNGNFTITDFNTTGTFTSGGVSTFESGFLSLASSTVTGGGLTTVGYSTTTQALIVQGASATSTFAGGLAIETSGLVYDYQTNRVGIGTASPSNTLTVSGNADVTGNFGIGDATPTFTLDVTGSGRFTSLVDASHFVATSSSATSTFAGGLAVETSGLVYDYQTNRVGIGTAAPTVALDVVGQGTFSATSTASYFAASDLGAAGAPAFTFSGDPNTGLWSSTADTLNISTAGSERLRIDSSGNVGIGTTSPWALLSINPNGITGPAFAVGSSTATNLVVTNGGRTGIGTTNPYGRLSVSSSGAAQTWAQVGSNTTVSSGSMYSALAALSSNRVAYIDYTNDSLRTYEWNGSTWSQVGSGLSIAAVGAPALASLSPNLVAYIDDANDSLRTYEWNGSTWSQVGSGLSISTVSFPTLTALSPNRVAFIDSANDSLRTYEFNGSTWSQVGSSLSVSTTGSPALTALSPNRVAFIDSTNDSLRTYEWNGSTWSQVGSGLTVSIGAAPSLSPLSPASVALSWGDGISSRSLRTYEFNGSTWALVGNELLISTGGAVAPSITSLSSNRIAWHMPGNSVLRTYQWSEPVFFAGNSSDYPYFAVSDAGYTTAESLAVRTELRVGQSATSTQSTSTPALTVWGPATFGSSIGLGTTSPWANLSVVGLTAQTAPLFHVASSSQATDFFTITNSGNVGIGTTSPYTALAVAGHSGVLANIFTATSTTATSTFAGGLAVETSGLVYDYQTNRVGIGTASPTVALDVTGAGTFSATSTASYFAASDLGAVGAPAFTFSGDPNTGLWSSTADTLNVSTAGSERVRVDSTGRVGIGTTSPYAKLSVVGETVAAYFTATTTTASTFPYASSTAISVSGTGYFGTASSTNLTVSSLFSSRIPYITTNGAFTDSSSFTFDGTTVTLPSLSATAATSTSLFATTASSTNLTALSASVTNLSVTNSAATTTFAGGLAVETSGLVYDYQTNRVGIGTASPTVALDVTGAGTFSATSTASYFAASDLGAVGAPAFTFSGDPNTGLWSSAADTLNFSTGGSEWARFSSSGNFGIGTTSPYAKLSVVGETVAEYFTATSTNATSTFQGVILAKDGGLVGVGTSTPWKKFSVTNTVSDAQVSIAYDSTRYANLQVDSVGDLIIDAQGGDIRFNDENLFVCSGGACASGSPSGTGNLIIESSFGVGSSTPFAKISVGADGSIVTTEKALSDGATISVSWLDGNQQLVTLGGNRTINFSNYIAGQTLRLILCQDATGSRTITWGTTVLWDGGTAPTLTTTASKCDVVTFIATVATSTLTVFGSSVLNF